MKNQFATKLKYQDKSLKKHDAIEKRLFDLESKLKFEFDKSKKDIFDLKKDSSRITNILNKTREIQELDFNDCKKKDFKTQKKPQKTLEKNQGKLEEKQKKHKKNKERDYDCDTHLGTYALVRTLSHDYEQACRRSQVADENFRAINSARTFEDELEMRDMLGRSWLQLENESAKLKIKMQNILFAELEELANKNKKEYEDTLKKEEEKNKKYYDEIKKREEKNKEYFEEMKKLDKERKEYYKNL